jgi:rare lipoprotein A
MIAHRRAPRQRIRDRYRPGTGHVERARRRLWTLAVALGVCLTLLPTSQAKALTIDLETLLKGVSQVLTDVGGSPSSAGAETPEHGRGKVGQEAAVQTHPTPVAIEQGSDLAVAPAPAAKSGKASWYGERFAGRKTASGERFNPQAMTTAHKSLPFGTDLEVCRKGQCVEVRVTDRGPFTPGRSLDLSRAAFAQLAPTSRGVINVEWRVL